MGHALLNTGSKAFEANVRAYLIGCMQDDEAEGMTSEAKASRIVERIRSEVGYLEAREGKVAMVEHWLSGLGMAIDYTYREILTAAATMHGLKHMDEIPEGKRDQIVNNWFRFMAVKAVKVLKV